MSRVNVVTAIAVLGALLAGYVVRALLDYQYHRDHPNERFGDVR